MWLWRDETKEIILYPHGIIWWVLIGWWWRPLLTINWNIIKKFLNLNVKFIEIKKNDN